jgi:hypothetical protein
MFRLVSVESTLFMQLLLLMALEVMLGGVTVVHGTSPSSDVIKLLSHWKVLVYIDLLKVLLGTL